MKYIHTNIIARDYKKLAEFYVKVFHCENIYVKRNLKGKWIETGTGVEDVHIEGVHLKLPGYEKSGPTLEIFQYNKSISPKAKNINKEGFAHIAFQVDDVKKTLEEVLKAGGGQLSEIVKEHLPGIGTLTFVYAHDPENNYIELQKYE